VSDKGLFLAEQPCYPVWFGLSSSVLAQTGQKRTPYNYWTINVARSISEAPVNPCLPAVLYLLSSQNSDQLGGNLGAVRKLGLVKGDDVGSVTRAKHLP